MRTYLCTISGCALRNAGTQSLESRRRRTLSQSSPVSWLSFAIIFELLSAGHSVVVVLRWEAVCNFVATRNILWMSVSVCLCAFVYALTIQWRIHWRGRRTCHQPATLLERGQMVTLRTERDTEQASNSLVRSLDFAAAAKKKETEGERDRRGRCMVKV